jgi:hypothetical protein
MKRGHIIKEEISVYLRIASRVASRQEQAAEVGSGERASGRSAERRLPCDLKLFE